MIRTGAQLIWESLVRHQVSTVFGYPGGAILPAYDAILQYPLRHVLVRHEQSAAHMADGYARASGRPGVAIATSGPGATNLVTGIATAMMDSSPIVCITGQVSSHVLGSDAFQEIDIVGITIPVTKYNCLVRRAEDIAPAIDEAFRVATSGRPGPVLVDITKDAQQASIEWDAPPPRDAEERPAPPRHAPEDLDRALALIAGARRPVILAGRGVLLSGACEQLREFAERTQTPVAMTLLGIGSLPASHALNLGMMGMHGEAWVNHAIQQSDLLLAFGMRFDDRVTGTPSTYAPLARKIHAELDVSEVNKIIAVDVALVGDLAGTLDQLLSHVPRLEHDDWLAHIAGLKGDVAVRDIQHMPDHGRLFAAHVIHDIWRMTEGRAVVATDVGQHQMWEAQYYHHELPRSLITSGGLGTMGFGFPAAIGAKMACPDAEVWAIVGDGGFQMTQAELATAAQEGVKVNIAVINNGYLGMVRQWQEFFYGRRYSSTPISGPDLSTLAAAHGLRSVRVDTRDQVESAIRFARAAEGTVLLDFRVEQEDSVFPMVPAGAALDAMIRRLEPSRLVETSADPG
ncbi:MAG TPA: biosynthetic-type acetolactate synthase large subunit [Vicinamibacterales bacterium]|jgi:acetolactate synthase-1/2/3 large subunit|nr:biosynthetic-type acetolactate synthase large subunit [Vicinamibacterales bacterium]